MTRIKCNFYLIKYEKYILNTTLKSKKTMKFKTTLKITINYEANYNEILLVIILLLYWNAYEDDKDKKPNTFILLFKRYKEF